MRTKGRYGHLIRWIFIFIDFIIINASYFFTCVIDDLWQDAFYARSVWLMLNISFAVVIYALGTFHHKRVVYLDRVLILLVKYILLHSVIFLVLVSFIHAMPSFRSAIIFYLLFTIMLSLWWIVSRKLLKWYRGKGYNYKRIVVIGGGKSGAGLRLIEELEKDQGYGFNIMGYFDSDNITESSYYKGDIDKVEDFLNSNIIDEVYCAIPEDDRNQLKHIINLAERNAIDFYYVPQLGRYFSRRFEIENLGAIPVLSIRPQPLNNPVNKAIKRLFDIVSSSLFLILSPVIFIPIAIGVKLSSPGPVFFRQVRTGYRGKSFTCLKFRSMRVNDKSDTQQATINDPRETKFGNFLRKTSLDELPQFINVLKGDMSIVGPRPHMVQQTHEYSELIDKYMLRHTIRPGITGWAQVNGFRGPTDELWKMEKRVEYDVWYSENWNFMLDIKIILLTVFHVIRGDRNALCVTHYNDKRNG